MAPPAGMTRRALLDALCASNATERLPIRILWMEPCAVVDVEEGRWSMRRLRCNEERAEAEHQARTARGDHYWMPEHRFAFFEPAETMLSAPTKEDFIAAVEAMEWPFAPG